jgi:hypothetical protein
VEVRFAANASVVAGDHARASGSEQKEPFRAEPGVDRDIPAHLVTRVGYHGTEPASIVAGAFTAKPADRHFGILPNGRSLIQLAAIVAITQTTNRSSRFHRPGAIGSNAAE